MTILYYTLLAIFFAISVTFTNYISSFKIIDERFVLLITSILFAVIIYFLKNNNYIKDDFHFQVTPQKLCDGGSYMYTSDPERKKLCDSFSNEDLSKYSCCPGFHGRPVWFNRSDESDSNWENSMCKDGLDNFDTHVL